MSEQNVAAFKRGVEAFERRDVEAVLQVLDPKVEWHPALHAMLGGEATIYRGHEGIRMLFREVNEAFVALRVEIFDIRDLGDRLVATGRMRARGKTSGAETESPIGYLADVKNGKMLRVRTFLDPDDALAAAGLRK